MSDAAIANIVTGLVTITITVVGFLTLWIKLKYGTDERVGIVEGKVDHNTVVTNEAKEAATKASEHTGLCDEERARILRILEEHDGKIKNLEGQMTAVKISVDGVSKNVDSSRHEMRGHLQTLTNKLDTMMVIKKDQ